MGAGGGIRRNGRAYALQLLYAFDVNAAQEPAAAIDSFNQLFDLSLSPESIQFADQLFHGVQKDLEAIDGVLESASRNWRVERMARVDRNVLRLATHELRSSPDVPTKVVLNEAVDLAKLYGTAESAPFVNGILDRIASLVRKKES